MSSSSKTSLAQGKGESSSTMNDSSNIASSESSHKITTFFPVLRPEGRAKMCASKMGDSKQKEILQKLKSKETPPLRSKSSDTKVGPEQSAKSDVNSLQNKEKPRRNISVMSALKTPLSQVLRKSIEASEVKKEQSEKTQDTSEKKESFPTEKSLEAPKQSQRAKKSFPESESGRALRRSLKPSHATKSFSSLRSSVKRTTDLNPSSGLTSVRRRVTVSESGETTPTKTFIPKSLTQSASSSPRVTASPSPIEDGEHGTSNQSNASGGKMKKNRKRHFRGATYSLFLSKKSKKKNMKLKSADESKDDECSLAGTENSSYLDSEDGNSLMSEDLYTPSEKSLADEEHNTDSRTSPMLVSEQKTTTTEATEDQTDLIKSENLISQTESEVQHTIRNESEEVSQNATDMIQQLEGMEWESNSKYDGAESQFPLEALKAPQYDDISNESFSNSTSFPFKTSPNENAGGGNKETEVAAFVELDKNSPGVDDVIKETNPVGTSEICDGEDKNLATILEDDENTDAVMPPQDQSSSILDSSGQEQDLETPLTSRPTSGDENENDGPIADASDGQNTERDPNDAQSTIATCVKSRQRIKRRFTDDIVDTDVGLLSLHSSMAPPRKALPKPDPPKDVIQTYQPVTHSEAKKGPVPRIECIYNSHQEPVKSCTCEGDTYEANLGNEDEGVFCQAVDSIDDKLVGCSNPVVTPKLVRPSVKIPFTIMCEMHLWRLKHHHSCPYCGLFCSQGHFMQCSSTKNKQRIVHLFHEQCQSKEEGVVPFCLHCGTSSGMKRVQLEMHMASPPSFFLSQIPSLPQPNVEKARISFSSAAELLRKSKDELSAFEYRIEDTGKVLSSVGLKNGPEKEELDRLVQAMKDEKVVPTLYAPDELYDVASEGNVLKILNILAQGVDPNKKFSDHENETALHAAAAGGFTTVVHLLIQAGAINDALNERIYTPLMLAVESNHNDVVFYLVKNGAVADYKGESGMSSFHIAAKNGNLEILKTLLTSRDVDINSQDDGGWTPIVWASEHDHYGVVQYLLKRGANPNIKDNEGNTGLHWSAFSGSVDICFLYLDYGCDIDAVNERGDTPLHIAARQDSISCVTNKNKPRPVTGLVRLREYLEISGKINLPQFGLFLSRGANVQIKNKADLIPAECVIDKNSDTYLSLSLNMLLKKIAGKYQHRAEKILHKDVSRGKEQIAIQCVNEVDNEPPPVDFLYVTENCETTPMNIDRTITSLQSCHCDDDCSTSACTCASISYQCWYDKEGLLLPHFNMMDPPMIFECNRACSCWSLNCRNRVLQNGMTCRLQLIRTKGKGWGVRTLKDIPKGTFICEYVGEMISDSAADKRADDSYLFDLDNRDGETYCLDARYYGNISRFINHLCEPNLVPVKVYVDHQDLNFPRIAFFSSRDIKQYEELGFDYCEKFWVIKYKYFTCDCGSVKCKYSKDTIHQTLANYYRRVREEQMLEEGTQQPPVQDIPLIN